MTEQDEPRPEDEAPEGEAPQEETPAEEEPTPDEPVAEEPTPEEPDEVVAASSDEPAADEPATDESTAGAQPDAGEEEPAAEPPADVPAEAEAPADDAAEADAPTEAPERQRGGRRDRGGSQSGEPEAIPGAHLEPDLVLEEAAPRGEYGERSAAEIEAAEASFESDDGQAGDGEVGSEPAPVPSTILELAADARYRATGKRKSAVARVTLRPGTGVYTINGRELDSFFPRPTLQRTARGPLETVGQQERMDVVATIHGGGVSAQAGALRHGVARALVEADPALRSELKRRGFLTRDPRVKERKKAGLKKARKRPQFSKR